MPVIPPYEAPAQTTNPQTDSRAPIQSGNYLESFQFDYKDLAANAAIQNLGNVPKYLYNYGIGALGKGLFWLDRPYTAVMSGLDAAITNGDVFGEAWKGLTGRRQAGFQNILEDVGADPNSGWTTLGGVGLDVVVGTFLDPMSYLTLGMAPLAKGVIKSSSKVGALLEAGRYSPEFMASWNRLAQLKSVRRADLAREGLYGLNVRLPYLPVIGKHIEDAVSGMGDFGKKLTREGYAVTPKFINEKWAQGLDSFTDHPYFQTVYDKIRQYVGGDYYNLKKAGLVDVNEFKDILQSKQMKDALHFMAQEHLLTSQMGEAEKAWRQADMAEQPWIVNAGSPITVGKFVKLSEEERAKVIAENNKLIDARNVVTELFNRGAIAEIHGIRSQLDGWVSSRKRIVAVNLGDMFAHQARGAEGASYAEAASAAVKGGPIADYGDWVESILSNPSRIVDDFTGLANFDPFAALGNDGLARQWRNLQKANDEAIGMGREPVAGARFLAFAPSSEVGAARSGPMVPRFVSKNARKEEGWFFRWKRGQLDDEAAIWESFGGVKTSYRPELGEAPVYPAGFEERLQRLQEYKKASEAEREVRLRNRTPNELEREMEKIANRHAGVHSNQEMEFSRDLGNRDMALFEVDAFDTLSSEFKGAGGAANPIEIRKQRMNAVLDKLQNYIEQGGNITKRTIYGKEHDVVDATGDAWSLVNKYWLSERSNAAHIADESIGKPARKAWVDAAKKAGLDPSDETTKLILDAIYLRRVAYKALPGDYAAGALAHSNYQLARAMFGGGKASEVLDPVALHWTNHEELRRQLDVLERHMEDVRQGRIPVTAAPDLLSPEEMAKLREAGTLPEQTKAGIADDMAELHVLKQQHEKMLLTHDPEDERVAEIANRMDDLRERVWVRELATADIGPDITSPREVEARYMARLLEKRDQIISLLKSTEDPFLTARKVHDQLTVQREIAPEVLRREGYVMSQEEVEGLKVSGPELERHDAVMSMINEIRDGTLNIFRQYDPNFRMRIENYLPHMFAKNKSAAAERSSAWERFKQGFGIQNKKKAMIEFKAQRIGELQHMGMSLEQAQAAAELETIGRFGIKMVHLAPKELKGGVPFLEERQYGRVVENPYGPGNIELNTLMALRRSSVTMESDISVLLNQMHHNAQKLDFSHQIVKKLVDDGMAIDVSKITAEEAAQKLGQDWRKLNAEWILKPLEDKGMVNPFKDLAVSKEVYNWYTKTMTGMSSFALSSPGLQKLINVTEGFRRWFSAWTLLPFPSYHVRNIFGDTLRAMQEGLDPTRRDSHAFAWHAAMPTKDETNYPLFIKAAVAGPVPEAMGSVGVPIPQPSGNPLTETVNKWLGMVPETDPTRGSLTPESLIHYLYANVIEHNLRDVDVGPQMVEREAPASLGKDWATRLGKFAKKLPLVGTESNPILQFAGKWGTALSNYTRANLWYQVVDNALKDGLTDLRGAMKMGDDAVRRALFNYSDLTDFERHVLKNVNFFYTYMARSLPFHIEKMITRPDQLAPYARAYNALWSNADDKGMTPDDMRGFLVDQMSVPLYKAKDPDGHDAWVVWSPTNWFGIADVHEAAGWLRSFATMTPGGAEVDTTGILQALGMNINPVMKAAVENIFKKDMLTGQDIDGRQWSDVLGIPMPTPAARLIKNIRLVSEFDRLNPGDVWGKVARFQGNIVDERAHRHEAPEKERWAQFLTGARLFESVPVKDIRRNILDIEHNLTETKSVVKRAMRSGNLREARENQYALLNTVIPELKDMNDRLRYWQTKEHEAEAVSAINIANRNP